jgi:flagellar biosynthesis protein FliR
MTTQFLGVDLFNLAMVFLRANGFLALFPLFSSHGFSIRLRVVLGMALSVLVAPLLPPMDSAKLTLPDLMALMVAEVSVGFFLGFVSRMVFYTIDFAGALAATEIGLSISPNPNPFTSTQSDTPGLMLYFLGLMVFFSLDLHHWLLVAFQKTYEVLPVGGVHLHEVALIDLINRTSRMFVAGIQITAPIIAVSFLVNLVFSLLSRAVPQMNVFSESFPVRIVCGLAVFGLTLDLMAQHVLNFLRQVPDDLVRVAKLLGTA